MAGSPGAMGCLHREQGSMTMMVCRLHWFTFLSL